MAELTSMLEHDPLLVTGTGSLAGPNGERFQIRGAVDRFYFDDYLFESTCTRPDTGALHVAGYSVTLTSTSASISTSGTYRT